MFADTGMAAVERLLAASCSNALCAHLARVDTLLFKVYRVLRSRILSICICSPLSVNRCLSIVVCQSFGASVARAIPPPPRRSSSSLLAALVVMPFLLIFQLAVVVGVVVLLDASSYMPRRPLAHLSAPSSHASSASVAFSRHECAYRLRSLRRFEGSFTL